MSSRLCVRTSLLCGTLAALFAGCGLRTGTLSQPDPAWVKRSSSAITLTRDGSLLLTANPDSNSVTVVQTDSLSVLAELPVGGDPRTVAVTEDSERAVVANRAAGSMSLIDLEPPRVVAEVPVGRLPWGVLLAPDGASAYVACEESDHVAVVDLDERAVRKVIPVYDRPNGLALSADGKSLYVTHLLDGRVSVIDLSGGEVSAVIETWPDSNLSQSIVLHLDGRRGYLPQTRSNNANPSLTFDSTVFPLITAIDLIEGKLLTRGAISLPEADMPVGLPYDAAFSPEGDLLYVVNAASNDLSVIDLKAHVALAHIEVQDNPRGIVLSHDGQYAYVNNTLAGTLSVIDTATQRVIRDVQVTQIPLPPVLLHGKRLFHSSDSQALSRDQWISCNTCHWEGEHDGRTWLFRFAGPRNTTSLLGMVQTYPLRWSAEWDEAADSEFAIIQEQYGVGLLGEEMHPPLGEPNSSRSYDLDALGAFLDSLQRPPNPYVDAYAPQLVREGAALFDAPDVGCRECHPPPYYTDFQTHNVGTAEGERELLGPEIDTPTLLSLYRSAPYLHDGSAATLMEVLTSANPGDRHGVTSGLEESDLEALVAYMLTLH